MMELLRPGSWRSGCFRFVLEELLRERPDITDWVSEDGWSSERRVLCGNLKAGGEEGCMGRVEFDG